MSWEKTYNGIKTISRVHKDINSFDSADYIIEILDNVSSAVFTDEKA